MPFEVLHRCLLNPSKEAKKVAREEPLWVGSLRLFNESTPEPEYVEGGMECWPLLPALSQDFTKALQKVDLFSIDPRCCYYPPMSPSL